MTPTEFRNLLKQRSDEQLIASCLTEDSIPFVFDMKSTSWTAFRKELSEKLETHTENIRIVGSGRFGFSLKPGNKFRGFKDTSDIDLVIVDATKFDDLWHRLLNAAYPRDSLVQQLGGWLKRRRNEVYTGWLSPLDVKIDRSIYGPKAQPILDFNVAWFNALKNASRLVPRRHEDIKVRLYRSWPHAAMYHMNSIASLRSTL